MELAPSLLVNRDQYSRRFKWRDGGGGKSVNVHIDLQVSGALLPSYSHNSKDQTTVYIYKINEML